MVFFWMLKRDAKLALRDIWGRAIGAVAFVAAVSGLLGGLQGLALQVLVVRQGGGNPAVDLPQQYHGEFIGALFGGYWLQTLILSAFTLASLLLLSPLLLGVNRFYYCLAGEDRPGFLDLFYFFESFRRYARAVWHTVELSFRAFFWGCITFAFPVGIMAVSASFLRIEHLDRPSRAAASAGVLLALGVFILATALYLILLSKYALSGYLLCADDGLTARGAIDASARYTKGERGMILAFSLSFAPWYLIMPFTFGLLMLFIAPYHSAAAALLCRYLAERGTALEPSAQSGE